MSRPLRIQYPGAFYHVMNRGIRRNSIFPAPVQDRLLFQRTLHDSVKLWKIRIHAYSLMDNHYHLLIETPLGNISRAMQHIDGIYTQRFNKIHQHDGPLIRGRFKSILVQKESYFLELIRYIHLNGVRALRYPSAKEDPHGSHKDYLHPHQAPPWLERNLVLSYFSRREGPPLQELDQFVHQGVSEDLGKVLAKKRWPAILGTKDFVESIRLKFLSTRSATKDVPQTGQIQRWQIFNPNQVILEVFDLYEREYGPGGVSREGRWAIFYALRTYAHLSYQDIATLVGGISYDAVDKFLKRNDLTESRFIRLVRDHFETQMSNVEIRPH